MPRRESRYTTNWPSGDQAPSNSDPGCAARPTTSVPSGCIAKTSSKSSNTMRPLSSVSSIGSPTETGVYPISSRRLDLAGLDVGAELAIGAGVVGVADVDDGAFVVAPDDASSSLHAVARIAPATTATNAVDRNDQPVLISVPTPPTSAGFRRASSVSEQLVHARCLARLVVTFGEVRSVARRVGVEASREFELAVPLVEVCRDRIAPWDACFDLSERRQPGEWSVCLA